MDDQENLTQTPYARIMGVQGGSDPVKPAGWQAVTSQNPILANASEPARDDLEVAQRAEKWKALMSDPNLNRALGWAGASLLMPKQLGDGKWSPLARSFLIGQNAYSLGQAADYTRAGEDQTRSQSAAESAARVEASGASTAQSRAQTATLDAARPGVAAKAGVEVGTAETQIKAAQTNLEGLLLSVEQKKANVPLENIEREVKMLRAKIERDLPEGEIRNAKRAELAMAEARLADLRAGTQLKGAQTGETNARTGVLEAQASGLDLDNEDKARRAELIDKMDPVEQREFLTKTGRYAASQSKAQQEATLYGSLYDKLKQTKPDHELIKGMSKEEFQMKWLKTAAAKDSMQLYVDAVRAGVDDADVLQMIKERAVFEGKQRPGSPQAAPGSAKAEAGISWKPAGPGMEFATVNGVTTFRRTKGAASPTPAPTSSPSPAPAAASPTASPSSPASPAAAAPTAPATGGDQSAFDSIYNSFEPKPDHRTRARILSMIDNAGLNEYQKNAIRFKLDGKS